jgi:hypothetical protein
MHPTTSDTSEALSTSTEAPAPQTDWVDLIHAAPANLSDEHLAHFQQLMKPKQTFK